MQHLLNYEITCNHELNVLTL